MIMNDKSQEWIRTLETEWSTPEGFLGKAREGTFDKRQPMLLSRRWRALSYQGKALLTEDLLHCSGTSPVFFAGGRNALRRRAAILLHLSS
jgi:hypothetical protein